MKHSLIFSLLLGAAAPSALAQNASVAPASAADAALADRLRALEGLPARKAQEHLKSQAAAGDAAAKELLAALQDRAATLKMEDKLRALSPSGSLVDQFRTLALDLEAARRNDAAVAAADDKALGPLPGEPKAPGDETEGWEHRTEVFAGATGVPGRGLPATGIAQESEYNKGPWKVELGARGLFAPTGKLLPSDGTLEAAGSRKIGDGPFRLFAGAELHRDDLMGLAQHFSLHGGVEAEIIDDERQQLSASFGVGGAAEKHLTGESEKHPLTLTSVEYALKLSAQATFHQEFELESNPKSRTDYEFKSVTSFVYDVSKNLALRLARQFTKRGEPVDGYAGTRTETTLGVVIPLK